MAVRPSFADSPAALLADVPQTWQHAYQQHKQQHTVCKAVSTDPLHMQDADAQTTDRCDAACQASTSGRVISAGQRGRADAHMPGFLQQVAPAMLAALSANSEAADSMAGKTAGPQPKREATAHRLFTLTAFASSNLLASSNTNSSRTTSSSAVASSGPHHNFNSNSSSSSSSSWGTVSRCNTHKLQVTSLSWSKTGQTLAASFGRYDISGWCCVPGALATWNLARLGARDDSSGRPDRLIDADTCVMCCAFHPAEPALLAGGTFNGELIIWDLSREDANAQVAKTDVLSEARHREPITAVSWQYSGQEARRRGSAAASYRLFTLGADGRLLVWLWDSLSNPVYGYELRLAQPGSDPRTCLGGSCMAFCPPASTHEEAGLLLVGTEGGRLLRCQFNDINAAALTDFSTRLAAAAAAPPGGSASKLELRSAVHDAKYKPFDGPVNALSACLHHRQLAVAAGGDGTLRVLDVLRSEPLLLLEPAAGGLLATAWSPSRPCVLAAAPDNCIHLYDLAVKQRIVRPVLQLQCGDVGAKTNGPLRSSINVIAFNEKMPSMLAAAAGDAVTVWQLPQRLVEPRAGEAKLLRRMLDSEDVSALLRAQCIVAS